MTSSRDLDQFEQRLGICFQDKSLLSHALRHPSYAFREKPSMFERLEFLGDRVLGLSIAQVLYKRFPESEEGGLSQGQAALVRKEFLAQKGTDWGLSQVMQVARGNVLGDFPMNILADGVEALLGALYLDQGFESVATFIEKEWGGSLGQLLEDGGKDAKSRLQEWTQSKKIGLPTYTIEECKGPDHAPEFVVLVTLTSRNKTWHAKGTGTSRKLAEQNAAHNLLGELRENV